MTPEPSRPVPTPATVAAQAAAKATQLARNIDAERARCGMSCDGLAARSGLSVHALRRRLRGEAQISATELHALSQALRVPATQLLDYTPELATR